MECVELAPAVGRAKTPESSKSRRQANYLRQREQAPRTHQKQTAQIVAVQQRRLQATAWVIPAQGNALGSCGRWARRPKACLISWYRKTWARQFLPRLKSAFRFASSVHFALLGRR